MRLWIPLISGFGLSSLCPVSGGERLPQTPPKFLFPIVWTILYILIGISWEKARKKKISDIMHAILVLLLVLWIVIFSCCKNKIYGWYLLACIIAITISCMILHDDDMSLLLLTPLLAWILIAYNLNYHSIT